MARYNKALWSGIGGLFSGAVGASAIIGIDWQSMLLAIIVAVLNVLITYLAPANKPPGE